MKDISGKYELIILHPSHFLMGGASVEIKHPVTQEFAKFFVSQNNSGFLHEGSPTGPRLPPFSSRGDIDPEVPLNPILVNFAAMVRLRRLIRQNLQWGRGLDQVAVTILQAAVMLHKVVTWNPESHPIFIEAPIPIQVPGSDQVHDLGNWPFSPTKIGPPLPTPSSSGIHPGTQSTHVSAMTPDEFLDLMEQGGFSLHLLGHEFSNWLGSSRSKFSGAPWPGPQQGPPP